MIFIAIAIFAALSYVVASSGRGSGDIDREKIDLVAGKIIQHMSLVRSAVQRIMLVNNCQDNELAFYDADGPLSVLNYMYPIDIASIRPECNVYDLQGGGLDEMIVPEEVERVDNDMNPGYSYQAAIDTFSRSFTPYRGYVRGIGKDYVNTSDFTASELVLAIQLKSREMCIALNKGLGVSNPGGEPPTNGSVFGNFFAGECRISSTRSCSVILRSYVITELDDQDAACFYNPNNSAFISTARYTFYMVMAPG